MGKESGIYCIRHIESGKLYIGSASDILTRWAGHRSTLKQHTHASKYLQRSWDKHGQAKFVFEILELCPKEELLTREQHYLDTLEPFNPSGYNTLRVAGSQKGRIKSPEELEKMRVKMTGRKDTPETRAKKSKSKMGNTYCVGRIASPAHRAKMGAWSKGRKASVETREKQRLKAIGRRDSPETRAKKSASRNGKKDSPETIEKKRQATLARSAKKRLESQAQLL